MDYVKCGSCGWWGHYMHLKFGYCPKCGSGDIRGVD
jgi:hypothetical protein